MSGQGSSYFDESLLKNESAKYIYVLNCEYSFCRERDLPIYKRYLFGEVFYEQ